MSKEKNPDKPVFATYTVMLESKAQEPKQTQKVSKLIAIN